MPRITLRSGQIIHYSDVGQTDSFSSSNITLYLHGLGSSQNYYGSVIPKLAGRQRCIAIDLPGSGRSPVPPASNPLARSVRRGEGDEHQAAGLEPATQSIQSLAATVIEFLDALDITGPVNMVGHSFSCLIVGWIAAKIRDRINKIVLIGPIVPSDTLSDVFYKRISAILKAGNLDTFADTIPEAATGSEATALQKSFIRELISGQDPNGYMSLCKVIAEADFGYHGIDARTLVIVGSEDKTARMDAAEGLFSVLKHEKKMWRVLQGCGHWHCIEMGEKVADLMIEFFYADT